MIKFNLTFRLKGIRSMYSGTVSLEYHADACNYPFPFIFLPFPAFFHLFIFRPDRDADDVSLHVSIIPLSHPGVFSSSAHSS